MDNKISFGKFTGKVLALALVATMLFSQFAYASSLVTAQSPSTGTESGQTQTSSSQGSGQNSSGLTASSDSQGTIYLADSDNGYGPGYTAQTEDETQSVGTTQDAGSGTQTGTETSSQASGDSGSSNQITIDTSVASPVIQSDYAILYDASNGQVLYGKNIDTQTPPASTAKLMTALVVLEQYNNMSTTITFQQSVINSLEVGATTAHMSAGDTLTVEQALNAILVGSSCDVAAQLATSLAGSETAFAALMTQKAASLGCTGTNFANASGLNSDAQYTTARDMAIIAAAALSNETIRSMISKTSYTLPATASRGALTLTNTNHFTTGSETAPEGYLAGKTGYTSKAGQCLATMSNINGQMLVTVVLKATKPNQYSDSRALYDYGKKILDAAGIVTTDTTGQTTETTTGSDSSSSASGTWEQTSEGMKYKKADGTYYMSEWLDLNGNTYFFGPDGIMCTGWQRFSNGAYYYFDPNNGGAMVKDKWVTDNGKSYYMSSTGAMATNTVIDEKYRVDENGVFVEQVG